ncbi:hypothetical protein HHK36_002302 [Tetracentron sinense]|uniref:DNA damage-inducible protein 1 n=1 Tax=Tetracentron sinense TaxID=13715 RepID=A0A834ZYS9_TETSI|nr:hypothetical protein HHK36_002302 [Tetracentron sinense]
MKITVMTADEQFISLDVENVKALLEVETGVSLQQQQLLFNGSEVRNSMRLRAIGVGDGDLVMMVSNASRSLTNFVLLSDDTKVIKGEIDVDIHMQDCVDLPKKLYNSAPTNVLSFNPDGSAVNPGAFQQQVRHDSNTMAQLLQDGGSKLEFSAEEEKELVIGLPLRMKRSLQLTSVECSQTDPEFAQVLLGNDLNRLQDVLRERHRQRSQLRRQQEEELALLHADPFDIESQKKIEASIRQKGIDENWAAALEYNPEAFARVVMLYVDMEVNGVPLKAFVDSGAQSTIISKSCAERCGLLRLLDQRYKGIAHGVGQSEILGRIHVAPIKIGNIFYPCSFMVLDAPNMEFLFGLDMLLKHQCIIDLKENVLRVGGGEVSIPFLQEKDIPSHFLDEGRFSKQASGSGSAAGPDFETKVAKLVELGFERDAVIQALRLSDGNEEQAAGFLFGG